MLCVPSAWGGGLRRFGPGYQLPRPIRTTISYSYGLTGCTDNLLRFVTTMFSSPGVSSIEYTPGSDLTSQQRTIDSLRSRI